MRWNKVMDSIMENKWGERVVVGFFIILALGLIFGTMKLAYILIGGYGIIVWMAMFMGVFWFLHHRYVGDD